MLKRLSWLVLAFAWLAVGETTPLVAQSWVGTAGLGVEVTDRSGRAVEGARVTLVYLGADGGGPETVTTDSRGRTEISGLAEGRWAVDVRHPSFLGYAADVDLRAGKKPKESNVARFKTGDSLESSSIKLFKVTGSRRATRSREASPPAPSAPQVRPRTPTAAPPAAQPQPRPEPAAPPSSSLPEAKTQPEVTTEPVSERPTEPAANTTSEITPTESPGPVKPEPETVKPEEPRAQLAPQSAESEATPKTAASSEPSDPTEMTKPGEASKPEPPSQPAQKPPTQRPVPLPPTVELPTDPPPPMPTPEPEAPQQLPAEPEAPPTVVATSPSATLPPGPEVERQPEVGSVPVTPPAAQPWTPPQPSADVPRIEPLGPMLRSYRDGTCAECQPGEWAAASEGWARAATTGTSSACPDDLADRFRSAARRVATAAPRDFSSYAGALNRAGSGSFVGRAGVGAAGAAQELAPHLGADSGCQVVAVKLPAGAKVIGFRFEAADSTGVGDCLPGKDCPIGDAAWADQAVVVRTEAGAIIAGLFENRSTEHDRQPRLTAFFIPASNWSP